MNDSKKNNNKVRDITQAALMIALTTMLLVITIYVPAFNLVSYFLSGLPMGVLIARRGFPVTACACFVVFVITFLITGRFVGTAGLLLMAVVPGMVAGFCVSRKKSYWTSFLCVSGTFLLGAVFSLIVLNSTVAGGGVQEMVNEIFDGISTQMKDVLPQIEHNMGEIGGAGNLDIKVVFEEAIKEAKSIFFLFIPSWIILFCSVFGFITLSACRAVFKKIKIEMSEPFKFHELKATKSMCYVAILTYILSRFTETGVYAATLMNISFLVYAAIGVCGFALLDCNVKKNIPSNFWRTLMYISICAAFFLLLGVMSYILILIGLLDGLVGFRRMEEEGGEGVKRNGE